MTLATVDSDGRPASKATNVTGVGNYGCYYLRTGTGQLAQGVAVFGQQASHLFLEFANPSVQPTYLARQPTHAARRRLFSPTIAEANASQSLQDALAMDVSEGDSTIEALRPTVEASQAEPGCLKFVVHRDLDDPDVLVVIERWASKEAPDEHLRQPDIQELNGSVAPLIAGVPRISISAPLERGDQTKATL